MIEKYSFQETIAAVSVLKDLTANRGLDGILHSMFNIEDKLQDSYVKIESTGQKSLSIHFSNCSKLFCDIHLKNNVFIKKFFLFNCA